MTAHAPTASGGSASGGSATDCCALADPPLDAASSQAFAPIFKALGDPVRLRLLSLIVAQGEVCVCDLVAAFAVSAPTISHHLKVLREAGLVDSERRGTWVYYRARMQTLDRLATLLGPSPRRG
ncbi:MAG: helix-turn-helix transcriptional regulator [Actinomycetales bacterium]|nr:helix-turn-helix transcriptional regulator [Actinomycetales bacterium]